MADHTGDPAAAARVGLPTLDLEKGFSPSPVAIDDGDSKYPFGEPWLQVSDIVHGFSSSTVAAIVDREASDEHIKKVLHDLPDPPAQGLRIYDIRRGLIEPQRAAVRDLLDAHLKIWMPESIFRHREHVDDAQDGARSFNPRTDLLADWNDIAHGTRVFDLENLQRQWSHSSSDRQKRVTVHIPSIQSMRQHHGVRWTNSHASLACRTLESSVVVVHVYPSDSTELLDPIFGLRMAPADVLDVSMTDPHKPYPHPGYFILGQRCRYPLLPQFALGGSFAQSQLIKLVVLEFIMQEVRNVLNVCRRSSSLKEQEAWYRPSSNVQSTLRRVRNCAEVCRYTEELHETVTFITRSIELEAQPTCTPALSLYLHQTCSTTAQLLTLATRNMSQYQRNWDTHRDLLNIREAEGVKRLTVLAALFLPLSLSAGILSMNSRLIEEPLHLFDFVGVFFVVSWLALLGYGAIVLFQKLVVYLTGSDGEDDDEDRNWESGRWTRIIAPVLTESTRKLFIVKKTETLLIYGALPLLWTLLAVSFTVSMVKDYGNDVQLGMKVLAYGVLVLFGLILVPVCLLTLDAFVTDSQVNKWRKLFERQLKIG